MSSESLNTPIPPSALENITQKSLLIFDLDGTLIDSVPDLADAVNAMLTTLGKANFSEDVIRHWVGNGGKVLVQRALSGSQTIDPNLTEDDTNQALALFFDYYHQNTCVRTQPYAGVSEGLRELKEQGYTLAIATNKPIDFVPAIVEKLGWQALFAYILGGDSLSAKKPDPMLLLHVCDQLGFSIAQSYMIGDSKNDILAGQNAGMDTLGLSYGYNYGQDIHDYHPTHTFDDFATLTEFLSHARV